MTEYRMHLMVCAGTGCISNKSLEIRDILEEEIKKAGLENEILVVTTGCNGFCAQGPIMVVQPEGIFYQMLTKEDIPRLVQEHFLNGRPVKDLMYTPSAQDAPIPKLSDIGFFAKQRLVALKNRGLIDPEKIDEYIGFDGYAALAKVLDGIGAEEIIKEITDSGLRGRGGAGFPTGKKWQFAQEAKSEQKFVVCNADEGDPGAFMDRSIIESDPHVVLEGMAIGAKAIGASQGYIYIRAEYPLAIERIEIAIKQARDYGLFGDDILGTGFKFDVSVFKGAGAFVCGEETALISSIEGKAPEPVIRPPFPVESGLWGKPTCINNVETWATIPTIINRGAKWFSRIGTEKSKGTKVFSLVGKIRNAGLVEVPMGITLKEIIYEIGGGIPGGKKFKAVQTGGPSGGCIPASLIDLPIDYERLAEAGSIMGSGGMIVLDEDTCAVDIAKYFLTFTNDESCGKCTSCREGSAALLEILTRICNGEGQEKDIELLGELSIAIKNASLCGLGQTLPNPVLSTLKYFRDEYLEHIKYKRCPAGVCRGIISSACQHTCPLGQDVPCYIGLIAQGKFDEAIEIVRKENPLPAICGRVCHHPCEDKCSAGEGDEEPISIRALKRFVADYEMERGIKFQPDRKPSNGDKVAIIGSGPAGLTCAYYLALEGYKVIIFEALPVAGGMLSVGIPEYRLPRQILNFEIDNIVKLGVEIKTNTAVGRDVQLADIKNEFKAIFIAAGAHQGIKMGIPGEDVAGVIDAVDFLRAVNLGQKIEIGTKVAVVGGGNAAVDAARSASRLGSEVVVLYRRTRAEMPADEEEIEELLGEGIEVKYLTAPVKVISEGGKLKSVECVQMELGEVDSGGRRKPVPIKGSEFTMELDSLIIAISQRPDVSFLNNGSCIKVSKWDTIEVDSETFHSAEEGVFAGGDVITGPNTVSDAMSHGKIAARMIDKYIKGLPVERTYQVTRPAIRVEPVELSGEEIEGLKKPAMPTLAVKKRRGNFDEVELGLVREMAMSEARRCLRCDLELQKEESVG